MLTLKSALTALSLVVLGTAATFANATAQTKPPVTLLPIIGNWLTVDDGGPALRVDGSLWSGKTDRAQLEVVSRSLFAQMDARFVNHGSAPAAFPLAIARTGGEVANGTLSVAFKMIGGASDQNAGIMFGLRPNGDYYFVRYNTKDGNVAVWEYVNGERSVLAKGAVEKQLAMNTWNELVVTINNGKVQGVITGTDMTVEHTLKAPVRGRVGVWVKRDAITVFRNFRIVQ